MGATGAMVRTAARAAHASAPAAREARIDRKCDTCAEQEPEKIQRAPDPSLGHRFGQVAVLPPAAPARAAAPAAAPVEVSDPSDASEQEAEQAAEEVMGLLSAGAPPGDPPALSAVTQPTVHRAADPTAA